MDYLLSCPCGHTLEWHRGDRGCVACMCSLDRDVALQSIIDKLEPEKVGRPSAQ